MSKICPHQLYMCDWQSPFGNAEYFTCWYKGEGCLYKQELTEALIKEMNKEIKTLPDLINAVESVLDIPENHHLIAVFENDESEDIIGWVVAENDVEADYPVYTTKELLEKFKRD